MTLHNWQNMTVKTNIIQIVLYIYIYIPQVEAQAYVVYKDTNHLLLFSIIVFSTTLIKTPMPSACYNSDIYFYIKNMKLNSIFYYMNINYSVLLQYNG